MSLVSQLNTVFTRIATEFKTIRTEITAAKPTQSIPFSRTGTLAVGAGTKRIYAPENRTITGIDIHCVTAPVGASLIVDVNKSGTTLFTTQTARPTIAAGNTVSLSNVPAVTSWTSGSYLTVDIDQVGSTTPGAELTLVVHYKKA